MELHAIAVLSISEMQYRTWERGGTAPMDISNPAILFTISTPLKV